MEETKLVMIAQLMYQQSGEEVNPTSIMRIPNTGSLNRYTAYVALTKSYTCLAHIYADGKVRIFVH